MTAGSWCELLQEALDQSSINDAYASTEVLLRKKQIVDCLARADEATARKLLKEAILRSDEYLKAGKYRDRVPACQAIYDKIRAHLEAGGRL